MNFIHLDLGTGLADFGPIRLQRFCSPKLSVVSCRVFAGCGPFYLPRFIAAHVPPPVHIFSSPLLTFDPKLTIPLSLSLRIPSGHRP